MIFYRKIFLTKKSSFFLQICSILTKYGITPKTPKLRLIFDNFCLFYENHKMVKFGLSVYPDLPTGIGRSQSWRDINRIVTTRRYQYPGAHSSASLASGTPSGCDHIERFPRGCDSGCQSCPDIQMKVTISTKITQNEKSELISKIQDFGNPKS